MPKLTALMTPREIAPGAITGDLAAVIDVLRATSSIATAIASGSLFVIPARDKEAALAQRERYPDALLGGEVGGFLIPGFDLGNSPSEYTRERVEGKGIIMSTSNGTKAVLAAKEGGASRIYTCSFLNLGAVAEKLVLLARTQPRDITVICSGSLGEGSLEDWGCAGALCHALMVALPHFTIEPEARAAAKTFGRYDGDVLRLLGDSPHGQALQSMGFGSDLGICARLNSLFVAPVLVDGKIVGDL